VRSAVESFEQLEKSRIASEFVIAGSVSDEQARLKYPNGWTAPKPYIRIVPQPGQVARV